MESTKIDSGVLRKSAERVIKEIRTNESVDNNAYLAAALDFGYFLTDGKLWERGRVNPLFTMPAGDENTFPDGTIVRFDPVSSDHSNRSGEFVFTKGEKSGEIQAKLKVRCKLTSKGHSDVQMKAESQDLKDNERNLLYLAGGYILYLGMLSAKKQKDWNF